MFVQTLSYPRGHRLRMARPQAWRSMLDWLAGSSPATRPVPRLWRTEPLPAGTVRTVRTGPGSRIECLTGLLWVSHSTASAVLVPAGMQVDLDLPGWAVVTALHGSTWRLPEHDAPP